MTVNHLKASVSNTVTLSANCKLQVTNRLVLQYKNLQAHYMKFKFLNVTTLYQSMKMTLCLVYSYSQDFCSQRGGRVCLVS